jgi:DNA-binding MarR family transcriptional regulator
MAHSVMDGAGTGSHPDDYRVVVALRELTVRLNRLGADFAARNDLHATDLRAIIELLDAQRAGVAATPTWLADRLRLNTASVTALVDRLENMGHVQRTRDYPDRRRVRLTVTDSAQRLGEAYFGPLIERVLIILAGFRSPERMAIRRFLAEIAEAAEED